MTNTITATMSTIEGTEVVRDTIPNLIEDLDYDVYDWGIFHLGETFIEMWEDTLSPFLSIEQDSFIDKVFIACDDNNLRGIKAAAEYYGMMEAEEANETEEMEEMTISKVRTNADLHALMMKAEEAEDTPEEKLIKTVQAHTETINYYAELTPTTRPEALRYFNEEVIEYAIDNRRIYQYVVDSISGVYFVCTDFEGKWEDVLRPLVSYGDRAEISRVLVMCDDNKVRGIERAADYYDANWD